MTSKICPELAWPKRDWRQTRTTSAQLADEFSCRSIAKLEPITISNSSRARVALKTLTKYARK